MLKKKDICEKSLKYNNKVDTVGSAKQKTMSNYVYYDGPSPEAPALRCRVPFSAFELYEY